MGYVCRDLCNCSICRNRKGWGPTGQLYRTVSRSRLEIVFELPCGQF